MGFECMYLVTLSWHIRFSVPTNSKTHESRSSPAIHPSWIRAMQPIQTSPKRHLKQDSKRHSTIQTNPKRHSKRHSTIQTNPKQHSTIQTNPKRHSKRGSKRDSKR
jgi:hypothetical protein